MPQMRSLYLDPDTRDLAIDGQGSLMMVEGDDEAAQALRLRASTATGEWWLDLLYGVAYDEILDRPYNAERARAAFLRALTAEPRVAEVTRLDLAFDRATRRLRMEFEARLTDGGLATAEVTV